MQEAAQNDALGAGAGWVEPGRPPSPAPEPTGLAGGLAPAGGGPGALASQIGRGVHGARAKGRPPGGLKTRPLTVLSTVYRPWAGLRLEEVILWQES